MESFTDKIFLIFVIILEKNGADFSQDYPNVIRFNLVHLCPSMLVYPFSVVLLCCSIVLSGSCYFLGILGKSKGKESNLLSAKSF